MKLWENCATWLAALCLAATPAPLAAQVPGRTVAMTFDDLPHAPNVDPDTAGVPLASARGERSASSAYLIIIAAKPQPSRPRSKPS